MKILKEAVDVMDKGGLIIYPTETCYGIGADATNMKSIEKIYEIKGRNPSKPIPILVSNLEMIKKYGLITKKIEGLVKKFMPGPLSIITRKIRPVSDPNQKGISFRISSHPVALELVKLLKKPLTTTSANISGQPSIYEIRKVIETFQDKVDMIIDFGNLPRTEPSTCVDMTREGNVKVIREGPILSESIMKEFMKAD
ncbi:MAG: L-threonylcarbamoyladenylate synthase [Candidatus Aenigmarchaeota archaeon]|nr:L-threonylcarbamoyladenylate synthase [Candidatus Aenigmarchaeota archaeon]